MKIALCNEVISEKPFEAQCAFAAALGYDSLELAPYTVGGDAPHRMGANARARVRRAAADAGIDFASLHWLLVKPQGLSITAADPAVRARTLDVMRRLVDLAADLGAHILVHGSPAQRRIPEGDEEAAKAARQRGCDAFATIAEDAARAGVVYCIEALAPPGANFVNRIDEAAAIVRAVGSPALRCMIDCSATSAVEGPDLAAVADRWLPTGLIAHVQVNDVNRRGPGQGHDRFAGLFASLRRHHYDGAVAVEPFDYVPDGPAAAARAIGYVRGILEAQS
jgi:D-psicose/D-tagatose/L-ribulose 3-epimerase